MLRIKLRSSLRSKASESEDVDHESIPFGQKIPKSSALRMKEFRERLKEDNDVYKAHLLAEAARNRHWRANLSEEKKQEQREKTRIRVQKWRQKRKIENAGLTENRKERKKPKTRMQIDKQRDYWRKKKREQRESMTSQKRRRINERRRKIYAEKQQSKENKNKNIEEPSNSKGYTKEAERKAIFRAKKLLPTSPQKFANVVAGLAAKASPRKRKALDENGTIILSPRKRKKFEQFQETLSKAENELQSTRRLRSRNALKKRKVLSHFLGKYSKEKRSGISWRFAIKCSELSLDDVLDDSRKQRKDKLSEDTVQRVESFYKDIGNSRQMAGKKDSNKKCDDPMQILQFSLKEAYKNFVEQNDCPVSFSKFAALRPRSVKTMGSNLFNNCLCEYCTNVEMKVKAINQKNKKSPVLSRYDISKLSLCKKPEKSKFHKRECIERNCNECGIKNLDTLLPLISGKKLLEWNKWETQTYNYQGTRKSRKVLQLKKGSVEVFMNELRTEIEVFSAHLHNAHWQYDQFLYITKTVPQNWAVMCMDFAENYTCVYQDEAQSAHWSHEQVTLFSIVAYFRCQTCNEVAHDSLVFVTDDKKHDSHAVQHFVSLGNQYLKEKHKLTIEREIHFSDGAASQFKSKTPFADVAHCIEDFGFHVEKHFFGTRHGKGPCDGEFGVVKRTASNAVLTRKAFIRSTEEFYEFSRKWLAKPQDENAENLCHHARRTFFHVKEKDINRNRPDRTNVKPIPETRKVHAVRFGKDLTLEKRALSCFCECCVEGAEEVEACLNKLHVRGWEKVTPTRKRKEKTSVLKDEIINETAKKEKHTDEDQIVTHENERIDFFHQAHLDLQEACNYLQLKKRCKKLMESSTFRKYTVKVDETITMINRGLHADSLAIRIQPKEWSNRMPVRISGDGNCLPRSASIACFGCEEYHQELRTRIVTTMCMNEDKYIDNSYLKQDLRLPNEEAEHLATTYTMMSAHYTPGDKITKTVTRRIFREETMQVLKMNEFMGIWQLFALSDVLGCRVVSVYPELGGQLPRMVLGRNISPLVEKNNTSFVVMWTSTREDMTSENWIPNHFAPLLQPIEIPDFLDSSADDDDDQGCGPVFDNTTIEFDDDDYHENLLEISGLSSILNSLQEKEELEEESETENLPAEKDCTFALDGLMSGLTYTFLKKERGKRVSGCLMIHGIPSSHQMWKGFFPHLIWNCWGQEFTLNLKISEMTEEMKIVQIFIEIKLKLIQQWVSLAITMIIHLTVDI